MTAIILTDIVFLYIRSYIERKMNNGKQAAKAEPKPKPAEQAAATAAGSAGTATATAEQAKITFLFRHKRRCGDAGA